MSTLTHIVFLLFPAVVLFGILVPLFILLRRKQEDAQTASVAWLCSLVPLALGLNGAIVNGYSGFWWLLGGLAGLCLSQPLLLRRPFIGMALLTAGQISLIASFGVMTGHLVPFVLVGACGLLLSLVIAALVERLRHWSIFFLPAVLCTSFLSSVLSLALPYAPGTLVMMVAVLLVFGSSILLIRHTDTGGQSFVWEYLTCSLPYSGLYLLALSVWL